MQQPKHARSTPSYNRNYSKARHEARAQAETFGRMRFEEFDAQAFSTVAGSVAPKLLGCVGIGFIALVVAGMLIAIASSVEALEVPVALIIFFGFIPAVAYGSTQFDLWHDRRRVKRRRGRR